MTDWSIQRYWEDVAIDDPLPTLEFALPYQRLIVQAAANRDFAPIHVNPNAARSQGAPDVFANNVFHLGMWERAVREFIGLRGTIRRLGPMRIQSYAVAGDTVTVDGRVVAKNGSDRLGIIQARIESRTGRGICTSGFVTVTLPMR